MKSPTNEPQKRQEVFLPFRELHIIPVSREAKSSEDGACVEQLLFLSNVASLTSPPLTPEYGLMAQ